MEDIVIPTIGTLLDFWAKMPDWKEITDELQSRFDDRVDLAILSTQQLVMHEQFPPGVISTMHRGGFTVFEIDLGTTSHCVHKETRAIDSSFHCHDELVRVNFVTSISSAECFRQSWDGNVRLLVLGSEFDWINPCTFPLSQVDVV